VSFPIQWSNEVVAAFTAAVWKVVVARQLQPHTAQQLLSVGHHLLLNFPLQHSIIQRSAPCVDPGQGNVGSFRPISAFFVSEAKARGLVSQPWL
jgi:hypothetical protein